MKFPVTLYQDEEG